MKVIEAIARFLQCPVESVTEWLDSFTLSFGEWWSSFIENMATGITVGIIEGVSVVVIAYAVYCACRVMCSGSNDEKFSEYISKSLIAALAYFFAKCGGRIILNYIGV